MSDDEEDSIFNSNFVMRRSQTPPPGEEDSQKEKRPLVMSNPRHTNSRSRSGSDRDHRQNSDEEQSKASTAPSLTPSLADLTSLSSRPDPRARTRYDSSSGRSGRSDSRSGKVSDHSGSTRKASHRATDVEQERARRRRHHKDARHEDTVYEEAEESDEDTSTLGSYFSRHTSNGGRSGGRGGYGGSGGYSSRHRKGGSGGFVRSIRSLFDGINIKTVVLCAMAMVAVVKLGHHPHQDGEITDVSDVSDSENFVPIDGLVKDVIDREDSQEENNEDGIEEMLTPHVRGGMVSNPLSSKEDESVNQNKNDETEDSTLENVVDVDVKSAPDALDVEGPGSAGSDEQKVDAEPEQQQEQLPPQSIMSGVPQQPMNSVQGQLPGVESGQSSSQGDMQQQQSVGGYSNINPMGMGGQFGQVGMPGQYADNGQAQSLMQGYPQQQQQQPGGYSNVQAGMTGGQLGQAGMMGGQFGQAGMMGGQFGQAGMMGGQFGLMDAQQQQLPPRQFPGGYSGGHIGAGGQLGLMDGVQQQQQQQPQNPQYSPGQQQQPMLQQGYYPNAASAGGFMGGPQQPMYPGQIVPPMGQQQMMQQQGQLGFGQDPQQSLSGQQGGVQDSASTATQDSPAQNVVAPEIIAAASMTESAAQVIQPDLVSAEQAPSAELPQEQQIQALGNVAVDLVSADQPPVAQLQQEQQPQAAAEVEVPLLKDVPQGYVPPAVPASVSDNLYELRNFKDSWDPYEPTDIPMFWHIPKAGGSSIKDALGGCHRFVQATEFGVTDGHINDQEIAIVYPRIPGGADTDRSPFVNIDSTTVAGIQRAKQMGFADSQLADVVVSPFVFETNDLFTQTARGRLFSVFRHPVDRAISMFYYIQVADWEPSYKPELKEWTLEQYAQSDIVENNWMTRQLSGQLGGELTDANLQKAMEVVRRKFLVGLMTQIEPSMTRFEKFFRWKYKVNPTNQEACRARLMGTGSNSNKANKKPLPQEGEPAWDLLAHQNNYDLPLYKYIEQLFVEQEAFVAGMPDDYRNIDATCCKCDPPTFPPEGFTCPEAVKNERRSR
ncbi:hypothetical protein HJC23_009301 [Cyclotella cryptica]|uniref:Sulfotransferase domain-containing protein n=1 Tax=Cyclotella cryptica TaxID=29204 RepID=A0ABD3QSA3_9STRA|eukprot:CCRYP_002265-RA/>CCRYP_002265-RA protein AED:0.02 eAED:0.02 QI:195/1/1/1/0.5/0.4/5/1601/1052